MSNSFFSLKTCLFATSGEGVEACSHCAEGYLTEEWRCVSSCSAGFYATEPSPEIADGHRICRRWAHWCVLRCGWFVYLLMAGLILVAGFCLSVCAPLCCSHACVCCVPCTSVVLCGQYVCWCVPAFSLCALLLRCDASCLTCVGPSRGNCSSCSSGHSLKEGVCFVSTVCTDGQSAIFFLYYALSCCSGKFNVTLSF